MTAIGTALREALDLRGMSVSELARALDQPEPTLRNLYDGKTRRPNKAMRAALDRFFDVPEGTTFRICEGRIPPSYPSDEVAEICRLAPQAPTEIRRHVLNVLRSAVA